MAAPKLTGTQLAIYRTLFEIAEAGAAAPSLCQLGADHNASTSTVERATAYLEKLNLIEIKYAGSNRRRYYVTSLNLWTKPQEHTRVGVRVWKGQTKERLCITGCGREFQSQGPHNRMCPTCRNDKSLGPLDHSSLPSSGRMTYTQRDTSK